MTPTTIVLPTSVATPQPPPDRDQYGLDSMTLFPRLTRASFTQQYGFQPPAWDPSKRIKRWYDSDAAGKDPEGLYLFKSWTVINGQPVLKEYFMTNAEAAVPNLPGQSIYPRFKAEPTKAMLVGPDGSGSPVNPEQLMSFPEAQALAAEVGGVATEATNMLWPFVYIWNGETRRVYNILVGQQSLGAAGLRGLKVANGVGASGTWDLTNPENPVWRSAASTDTGEQDPRPEIPIPMRDVASNEVAVLAFGGTINFKRLKPATEAGSSLGGTLRSLVEAIVMSEADYWLGKLLRR